MPLLITPPAPLLTTAATPLNSVYAIIDSVQYSRKGTAPKVINVVVGYYYNEAASVSAEQLSISGLPVTLTQQATPEHTDTLPIFTFLEGLLRAALEKVLPAGTTIETVP